MSVSVSETINAPREKVWAIITDIENAGNFIQAITDLRVLEQPEEGLVGLKWQETRIMFGKEAMETMWISSVEPGFWYETTAESHGMIYHSKLSLEESGAETKLTMDFRSIPQTLKARLFGLLFSLFNGTIVKAFAADLKDIKAQAES